MGIHRISIKGMAAAPTDGASARRRPLGLSPSRLVLVGVLAAVCVAGSVGLAACAASGSEAGSGCPAESGEIFAEPVREETVDSLKEIAGEGGASSSEGVGGNRTSGAADPAGAVGADDADDEEEAAAREWAASDLDITEDFRDSFDHGPKPAANQKYIVLHDTEGDSDAASVIDWWDGNGNLVAAHFVVNRDGSVWQCVPLDRIAHHAGYGDTGHNDRYGIAEDGRDDMAGSAPIGGDFADYAMNAWSVGIEMVHVGGEGDYPEAQLEAVDDLIAHIDGYFGFESEIIDHKAWRSGNSDTSPEFAGYLESYQETRRHDG